MMRWARRHVELAWPAGGPRWHLIINSTGGELVGACRRTVRPPFELVPEIPADGRCHRCDTHVPAAASDARMTESPPRREPLALRAIVVSSRNALHKTPDPDDLDRIKDRATELLLALEEASVRDGADAEVFARVDEARRQVSE